MDINLDPRLQLHLQSRLLKQARREEKMTHVSLHPRFAGRVRKSRAHRIQSTEITHGHRLGAWSSESVHPCSVLTHRGL